MMLFFSILVLSCIFASNLKNEVVAKSKSKSYIFDYLRYSRTSGVDKEVINDAETVYDTLAITDEILGLYIDVLDKAAPWRTFKQTLGELDKFRDDFSTESALLIGTIRDLMSQGIDAYYSASKYIFRWCDDATPLLNRYIDLFRNDHTADKAHTQKDILIEMLTRGIAEMKTAQDKISQSSLSFNGAAGQLTALNGRFQFEFNEKSTYFQEKVNNIRLGSYLGSSLFGLIGLGISAALVELKYVPEVKEKLAEIQSFYDNLRSTVDEASRNVDETKNKLNKEIIEIGNLKVKTEETKTFADLDNIPELRETLTQSGKSLINKCNEYRRKHAEQNNGN